MSRHLNKNPLINSICTNIILCGYSIYTYNTQVYFQYQVIRIMEKVKDHKLSRAWDIEIRTLLPIWISGSPAIGRNNRKEQVKLIVEIQSAGGSDTKDEPSYQVPRREEVPTVSGQDILRVGG